MHKWLIALLIVVILIASFIFFEFPLNVISPVFKSDIVTEYSAQYEIDPLLVTAVIKAESNFQRSAKSHRGAMGLMQILPSTAEELANELKYTNFKVAYLENPQINIHLGTYYLSKLITEFDGNIILALAAYNAGMGKVQGWYKKNPLLSVEISDIPYKETRKYVKKVMRNYKWLKWTQELRRLIRGKTT